MITLVNCWPGLFLMLIQVGTTPDFSSQELHSYQFSGPGFAILRPHCKALDLTKLDGELTDHLAMGLDPIRSLMKVAGNRGIGLRKNVVMRGRLDDVPTPSLLVLTERENGKKTTSLIFAARHEEGGIVAFEFRKHNSWRFYPYRKLGHVIEGFAITAKREGLHWTVRLAALLSLACLFVLALWKNGGMPAWGNPVLLGCIVVFVFAGCERSKTVIQEFDKSNPIELGEIKEGDKVEFDVKIAGQIGAVVRSCAVDCGCLRLAAPAVGQVIPASGQLLVPFTLSTEGHSGHYDRWAQFVLTKNEVEISIECPITYTTKSTPKFVPTPLILKQWQGELEIKGKGLITFRRTSEDEPANIDLKKTNESNFRLDILSSNTTVPQNGNVVDDRFHVELRALSTEALQDKSFRVCFDNDLPELSVPIEFARLHPIKPQLESIFIGYKEKGIVHVQVIQLDNLLDKTIEIDRISYDGDGKVSIRDELEAFHSGKNRFEVNIETEKKSGRKQGQLTVFYKNDLIQPTVIGFSWIN